MILEMDLLKTSIIKQPINNNKSKIWVNIKTLYKGYYAFDYFKGSIFEPKVASRFKWKVGHVNNLTNVNQKT